MPHLVQKGSSSSSSWNAPPAGDTIDPSQGSWGQWQPTYPQSSPYRKRAFSASHSRRRLSASHNVRHHRHRSPSYSPEPRSRHRSQGAHKRVSLNAPPLEDRKDDRASSPSRPSVSFPRRVASPPLAACLGPRSLLLNPRLAEVSTVATPYASFGRSPIKNGCKR